MAPIHARPVVEAGIDRSRKRMGVATLDMVQFQWYTEQCFDWPERKIPIFVAQFRFPSHIFIPMNSIFDPCLTDAP